MRTRLWSPGLAAAAVIAMCSTGARCAPAAETTPPAEETRREAIGPSPVVAPSLPAEYAPMARPPFFNSNEPRMIPDVQELARLKVQTPQWATQFVSFPSPVELLRSLGKANADTRKRAQAAIEEVVVSQMLPEDTGAHLIPLSRWAVLYEDWRDHGGTDVFLSKFQQGRCVIEVCESANHVIVLVRDLDGKRAEDLVGMLKKAYDYTGMLFHEHLKPSSLKSMQVFRNSLSPAYVYGYYKSRLDELSGEKGAEDLLTSEGLANENYSSAGASAVRFFTNGDFAAFMVLKPIYGADLKNPFEPRFQSAKPSRPDDVPFWEQEQADSGRAGSTDQVRHKQVEEYLGNYFYDEEGRKLSDRFPISELERAFLELTPEQKLAIVERKTVDEYYIKGMRAFASQDYSSALAFWTAILELEPENPRAVILLQMAIRERTDRDYKGNADKIKEDRYITNAQDAIARQQTRLLLRKEQRKQEQSKELAVVNYRTRALNFYSEGNYADALKEWKLLLSIDPGNPTAIFFKDICERRLKATQRQ